jgi:hypothetical protein
LPILFTFDVSEKFRRQPKRLACLQPGNYEFDGDVGGGGSRCKTGEVYAGTPLKAYFQV